MTRHTPAAIFNILRLAALLAVLAVPRHATAQIYDTWHLVLIDGQRSGWMHSREEDLGYGLKTTNRFQIEISRGEANILIRLESEFLETYEGRAVHMVTTHELGAAPVKKTFRWLDDGSITAIIEEDGVSTTQTIPGIRGDWLPPAAARRVLRQYLADRAPRFDYLVLDVMGGPATTKIQSEYLGPAVIEAVGKKIPVATLRTTQSTSPGVVTTEHIDSDGIPAQTELSLGGLTLTVVRSEREVALAPFEPAEILVNTFVTPSRAIADPRSLRAATYVLSLPEGVMPNLPDTGVQRVARIDERRARITINMNSVAPANPEELQDGAYYMGSQMVNWRDDEVGRLAERAIRGDRTLPPHQQAERARRFVSTYIRTKSLDVGLASASETCRTREGDCTEHAVLLAAMLRYYGVPSRIASGLIYAEEFAGRARIFGYHMWTQALIKDADGVLRWVDLDATLPPNTPFDATHIALSISPMNDGDVINSMATLAPLLGRLEIEVESTAHDPAPAPVSR